MIAGEVKGRYPNISCYIVSIYSAPKEDLRLLEKLADWTGYMGITTKRTIIKGDFILLYANWNCDAETSRAIQVFLNRLIWENGDGLVVNSASRRDALLDVYPVRPESVFTSCSIVQGIAYHCGVLAEVEWGENCHEH
jgi:hypothetical protein